MKEDVGRYDNIDLLRALAIMPVVLYHFTARHPDELTLFHGELPKASYGNLGVELFFIVSGYCIFMSIERCNNLPEFWAKRFGRIQPAYMAAALITYFVVTWFALPKRTVSVEHLLQNLVWLTGISVSIPRVDGAYWSLIIELKYYLLFGIIFFLSRKRFNPVDVWCMFTAIECGLALYLLKIAHWTPRAIVETLPTFPYAPLFLIGMAIYELPKLGIARRAIYPLTYVACVVTMAPYDAVSKAVLLSLLPLTLIVLSWKTMQIPAPLRFMGLISYPLYLIHQNVGLVVIRATAPFVNTDLARCTIAVVVVILIAYLIHTSVEFRFRRQFETLMRVPLQFVFEKVGALFKTDRESGNTK